MDANDLWDLAAEHQEKQRRAESAGDSNLARRHARLVELYSELAGRRSNG